MSAALGTSKCFEPEATVKLRSLTFRQHSRECDVRQVLVHSGLESQFLQLGAQVLTVPRAPSTRCLVRELLVVQDQGHTALRVSHVVLLSVLVAARPGAYVGSIMFHAVCPPEVRACLRYLCPYVRCSRDRFKDVNSVLAASLEGPRSHAQGPRITRLLFLI